MSSLLPVVSVLNWSIPPIRAMRLPTFCLQFPRLLVAADADGRQRLGCVAAVGDDQLLDAPRPAAGVVGDRETELVQRIVHLAVVGQAELPVQLGRDDRGGGGAAARLDQVELGALHRLDELQLLLEQNVQQRMDPVRPVDRRVDQLGDVVQAGRVLPAAGLVAPDEAAQDAGVADLGPSACAIGAWSSGGTGMYLRISSMSSSCLIRYSVIQVVLRSPAVL